ncbi:MAG: hypothetical protein AAF721_31030, partial [Myxococcota bacterium]
ALNQAFGPCPVVSPRRWPKFEGQHCDHLVTLVTEGIALPPLRGVGAISLFWRGGASDEPLALVATTTATLRKGLADDCGTFPKGYDRWWNDVGHPRASSFERGVSVRLERDDVPDDVIADALRCESGGFPEFPEEHEALMEELMEYSNFIGGFPNWIQGAETPEQDDGSPAHFFMQLSGPSDLFGESKLGDADVFLFLTDDGTLISVGQS